MAKQKRVTLLASAVRTSSNTSIPTESGGGSLGLSRFDRALLLLDVTAAATAAGDTLDVYLQKNLNPTGTAVWTDFVHFTQVLGNGGTKQYVAEVNAEVTPTSALHAVQDAALAAGVNQGPWSDDWRVKWVVASASAPSFTFSVTATLFGDD